MGRNRALTDDEKRQRREARRLATKREREWVRTIRPSEPTPSPVPYTGTPDPLPGMTLDCEVGSHQRCARSLRCPCPCHRRF